MHLNQEEPADWNYKQPEFRKVNKNYPILHAYLKNTFLKLQDEDKIAFSNDGQQACFNTGLISWDDKEIFALFFRERDPGPSRPDWYCKGFFDTYAIELGEFRANLPALPNYITDPADLVVDFSYDFEFQVGHILGDEENRLRLTEILRENIHLALSAIQGATASLRRRIRRNYKLAIPQWYPAERKIQLLLPLCLLSPNKADLVLVADKDKKSRVYRVRTLLRMDQAYSNARLLTRPDRDWLNP